MDRNMLHSFSWWINMSVLLTLTKSQALSNYGADSSRLTQWTNEFSAVHLQNHQTSGLKSNPRPVVVKCYAESWEVVVQADLFNTGIRVEGRHLRLGVEQQRDPSSCRAVPSGPAEFTLQARHTDCGTVKLPPTDQKIIYSNVLVYSPEPSSDGLLRLDGAAIPFECHYNKIYTVKTQTLLPTWVSFVFRTTAESFIDFSLKLMTGNWQFERESHVYYVGDPIHFEVSSILENHKPLRVFVDHCVATVTPDPKAALRYDFIDHYGCFADAYLTNSSARFFSRTEDHKIQFQLDAFTFYQENVNQIYITCQLTAVPFLVNAKSKHRACSLIDNRWRSADGDDEDCTSCAIPYPPEESPSRASFKSHTRVKSKQSLTSRGLSSDAPKQLPATYLRVHQRPPHVHSTPQFSAEQVREGDKTKGTLKLGPLIILHSPIASNFTNHKGQMGLGIVR